jgi:hypothetical protein
METCIINAIQSSKDWKIGHVLMPQIGKDTERAEELISRTALVEITSEPGKRID